MPRIHPSLTDRFPIWSRRDFLGRGVAASTIWGMLDWLAPLFGATRQAGQAKSCILLWLDGGPSHLETFDPKPDAPSEVRGPFGSIATAVPGMTLCEHLPRLATLAQHFSLVRSVTSPLGEHGLAHHYLLTGYKPTPVLRYPSYGAVVSSLRSSGDLPRYVAIPEIRGPAGAGFLGVEHEPFALGGDPASPDFRVRDLAPRPGLTPDRLARRREYLAQFDRRPTDPGGAAAGEASRPFDQAARLALSPQAHQAFDLRAESPQLRSKYGPRSFGQSCLLARRLVEHGVPFVAVQQTGWDTHDGLVVQLRDGYRGAKEGVGLVPTLDLALAALLEDLVERRLLDETLVVAMGEFGRTPKLNPRGGRDHWPRVFSVLFAGGGIRGGQVIGASDRVGESPLDEPVTPADLACTIYRQLGIDPATIHTTPDGRPVRINQDGRPIPRLT